MSQTVLIAGGSGLVGTALIESLQKDGYQVRLLTRSKPQTPWQFQWNPARKVIDEAAFHQVDYIINLAGSNVGKGRWTAEKKQEHLKSRVESTQLLVNKIIEQKLPLKKFIQASAIGYYGTSDKDIEWEENHPAGQDFLANLTRRWEAETDALIKAQIPTLILRIGVVLSKEDGAYKAIIKPVKWYSGMPLGRGNQYIPWIHIHDLVGVFHYGMVQESFTGVFNVVAPNPVTNKEFMKLGARLLRKPLWPINIPSAAIRLMLGEKADIVLEGNRVSCKKLLDTGFAFRYTYLESAVIELENVKSNQ